MAVDKELLEILACPFCKEAVETVELSETRRHQIREEYRSKFPTEEPVVEQGLRCIKCKRVFPIVSDIPVMLPDAALEES